MTDINNDLKTLYDCTQELVDHIIVIVESDNMVSIGFQIEDDNNNSTVMDALKECYRDSNVQFTFFSNITTIDEHDIIDSATYYGCDLDLRLDPPSLTGWYDYMNNSGDDNDDDEQMSNAKTHFLDYIATSLFSLIVSMVPIFNFAVPIFKLEQIGAANYLSVSSEF